MKLIFSPIRKDERLQISVKGDILTLNGEDFDFGPLPVGATFPKQAIPCKWLEGDVERTTEGELLVPLFLPHGPKAPAETLFPSPILATSDGPVNLPEFGEENEEAVMTEKVQDAT